MRNMAHGERSDLFWTRGNLGRRRRNSVRNGSKPARFRKQMSHCRTTSDRLRSKLAQIPPNSTKCGPHTWPNLVGFGPILARLALNSANFGRFPQDLAHVRSCLAKFGASLADFCNLGQFRPNLGGRRPEPGRTRPILADSGQSFSKLARFHRKWGGNSARYRPNCERT